MTLTVATVDEDGPGTKLAPTTVNRVLAAVSSFPVPAALGESPDSMDPEAGSRRHRRLTSGRGARSARCAETRTSGAAGGPGKRAGRKASTAPRSDPTICTYAIEEPYRRDIKGVRNLRESRHALAGKVFHGRKGEIYQRFYKGMEDQLGALGLVLNRITLWNTFYIDRALDHLRADGCPQLDRATSPGCPRSGASTST